MLNGFYFKNNHYVIALKDVLKFRLLPVRIVGTCQVEGLDGAWSQYFGIMTAASSQEDLKRAWKNF